MKKLIALTILVLSLNSFAAEVVCGNLKDGAKRFYPVNELALKIASDLNVITCNGDRFQEVVKSGKHTKKSVRITKEQLLKIRKAVKKASTTW